jgi:transcriptional regulator with XRE-family HTH domain
MKFCEALDHTLREFNITGKKIALESGLREATISDYRNGKSPILSDNLERIITALEPDARQYFFMNCLVGELDNRAIATLLYALSQRMEKQSPALVDERIPA